LPPARHDTTHRSPSPGPFDLSDVAAYRAWRQRKLESHTHHGQDVQVEIEDAGALRREELLRLLAVLRRTNRVIYSTRKPLDKAGLRRLGHSLGLARLDQNLCADEDAISSLQVVCADRQGEYIPYTARALNWHTDGYYNTPRQAVRAWLLHCVQNAATGGASALLDAEIAYILLRDEEPRWIEALMHPQAMTIPANVVDGREIRAEQTGPVFSVDARRGTLYMRYTARQRSIVWRADPATREATAFLSQILANDVQHVLRHRLEPGQGIISNNALHCRTGFEDDAQGQHRRLLYRARYLERVAGTHYDEVYP